MPDFLEWSGATTEKGGKQQERSERTKTPPDPAEGTRGAGREPPTRSAAFVPERGQKKTPEKGVFPYLDTIVISRRLLIRQNPHNYEGYTDF